MCALVILMAFGPGFDLAAFVFTAGLGAVFIAEVDFQAGKKLFETLQSVTDCRTYPLLETGTALHIVAVHLNVHRTTSLATCTELGGQVYRQGSGKALI